MIERFKKLFFCTVLAVLAIAVISRLLFDAVIETRVTRAISLATISQQLTAPSVSFSVIKTQTPSIGCQGKILNGVCIGEYGKLGIARENNDFIFKLI